MALAMRQARCTRRARSNESARRAASTRGSPPRVTSRLANDDDGAFHVAAALFGQSATVGHVVRTVHTRTRAVGPGYHTRHQNSLNVVAAAKLSGGARTAPNSLNMPLTVKTLVFY